MAEVRIAFMSSSTLEMGEPEIVRVSLSLLYVTFKPLSEMEEFLLICSASSALNAPSSSLKIVIGMIEPSLTVLVTLYVDSSTASMPSTLKPSGKSNASVTAVAPSV